MALPGGAPDRGHAPALAGVLFDMDGTLLDSEPLWDQALTALARRLGGVVSPAARLATIGTPEPETLAIIYRDLGVTAPDLAADRRFVAAQMAHLYATALAWRPGARELVDRVRAAGIPTALVTSTGRSLVEIALAGTLGRHRFEVVVCADDVTATKPDPQPYRLAAARLGAPVRRCVAIEDSPAGLASARDAGAVAIGVPGEVPLTGVPGVHLVSTLVGLEVPALERLVDGWGPAAAYRRVPG